MCSVLVVVADVLVHQPLQVPYVQNDHMIQQVSWAVANPAFGDSVLPWTAEAGSFRCDAEALSGTQDIDVEVCGTVKDKVPGYRVVWKGITVR